LANIVSDRINFASSKIHVDYPDFLDIQLKSFQEFFQLETNPENRSNEGLFKVFSENFPITDARNNFVLEFLDYFVDPPRYSMFVLRLPARMRSPSLAHGRAKVCTDPRVSRTHTPPKNSARNAFISVWT